MATNPPIVIGPFNNVPAPGSGVKSDWPQQISHYVTEQLARGLVARPVVVTADQAGVGATVVDLTGFLITFTVVAGRWYELSWMFSANQLTAAGLQATQATLDGAVIGLTAVSVTTGFVGLSAGTLQFVGGATIGGVPGVAAGSRVFKLRGSTSAGTMTIANANMANGRMAIKDIGSTVAIP
jgi:hypothetical protein